MGVDLSSLATSALQASTFQPPHEGAQHSTYNHPLAQFSKEDAVRRMDFVTVLLPEALEFVYSALLDGSRLLFG